MPEAGTVELPHTKHPDVPTFLPPERKPTAQPSLPEEDTSAQQAELLKQLGVVPVERPSDRPVLQVAKRAESRSKSSDTFVHRLFGRVGKAWDTVKNTMTKSITALMMRSLAKKNSEKK